MSGSRMRRVDEAVRAVLSDVITRELKDPRVGFVTVTAVKTSPDLRHARVYVSVLGDEETREASLDGLQSAHGFLQRRLAGELRLKHTPTLAFAYDDTLERGMRLTELLDDRDEPDVDDAEPTEPAA
jgi:ribosome-binding factor A